MGINKLINYHPIEYKWKQVKLFSVGNKVFLMNYKDMPIYYLSHNIKIKAKRLIKKLLPQKKIYRYGAIGLRVYDERTWKERLNDILYSICNRRRSYKNELAFLTLAKDDWTIDTFKPFLDCSGDTPRWINFRKEKRAIEKSGKLYIDHKERFAEAQKNRRYIEIKEAENRMKSLEKYAAHMRRGNSIYDSNRRIIEL